MKQSKSPSAAKRNRMLQSLTPTPNALIVPVARSSTSARCEPLQAVLERAHRAVVAVVEHNLERCDAAANAWRDTTVDRLHQTPDLGGDHDRPPVNRAKACAESVLRTACS